MALKNQDLSQWDTVLGNAFAPLFAHPAKGRRLSQEEIASLKKLIAKNEGGRS